VIVLVDTSVWITHFRAPISDLQVLAANSDLAIHSAVIGELAAGNLPRRTQTLADLDALLPVDEPDAKWVLAFLETHRLSGRGLSWVDIQLLAATHANRIHLWTLDTRLHTAGASLGIAWRP
jgi:predicted nucleic acid-binding protein